MTRESFLLFCFAETSCAIAPPLSASLIFHFPIRFKPPGPVADVSEILVYSCFPQHQKSVPKKLYKPTIFSYN